MRSRHVSTQLQDPDSTQVDKNIFALLNYEPISNCQFVALKFIAPTQLCDVHLNIQKPFVISTLAMSIFGVAT